MKYGLVFLALMMAAPAMAGLADQSWEEVNALDADYRIDVRWPKAGGYNVNTLCAAGDEFRTLTPVKVCTQYVDTTRRGNAYEGFTQACVATETRVVTIPRSGVSHVCTDLFYPRPSPRYDGPVCRQYGDVAYTIPTSFEVEIYSFARNYRDPQLLATKHFDVPACQ